MCYTFELNPPINLIKLPNLLQILIPNKAKKTPRAQT